MSAITRPKWITENDDDIGQAHTPHARHGQCGSLPPHPSAGQCDHSLRPPDHDDDASPPDEAVQKAREHQQIDLAMLRLTFRNILTGPPEEANNGDELRSRLRELSCSEFNQLVSGVVRLHGDERDLMGIQPPPYREHGEDHDDDLERLSTAELLELCYQEGITPPRTCETPPETEDPQCPGPT